MLPNDKNVKAFEIVHNHYKIFLLLAATVAEYGSKIYVFSDAVPRNDVTIRYIQAMQSEKDLTISLLLTGQCKQKRSMGKYMSKEAIRIIHIVH